MMPVKPNERGKALVNPIGPLMEQSESFSTMVTRKPSSWRPVKAYAGRALLPAPVSQSVQPFLPVLVPHEAEEGIERIVGQRPRKRIRLGKNLGNMPASSDAPREEGCIVVSYCNNSSSEDEPEDHENQDYAEPEAVNENDSADAAELAIPSRRKSTTRRSAARQPRHRGSSAATPPLPPSSLPDSAAGTPGLESVASSRTHSLQPDASLSSTAATTPEPERQLRSDSASLTFSLRSARSDKGRARGPGGREMMLPPSPALPRTALSLSPSSKPQSQPQQQQQQHSRLVITGAELGDTDETYYLPFPDDEAATKAHLKARFEMILRENKANRPKWRDEN